MKYAIIRELMGTAIPAQFTHNGIVIDATVLLLRFGDGFKFICARCGFNMYGGSPLNCPRCNAYDILVDYDRGEPRHPQHALPTDV